MNRLLAAIPSIAFAYVLIGQPVMDRLLPGAAGPQLVWPLLFSVTLLLTALTWRHFAWERFSNWATLLLALFLGYAALSISWAYSQPDSMKRWIQAVMVVATVLLPFGVRTEADRPDNLTSLFICYAISMVINAIFVATTPAMLEWTGAELGHSGYFLHKQYLGMAGSMAILLAIHQLTIGRLRILAVTTISLSLWILIASKSKTSLGFLLLVPTISAMAIYALKRTGASIVAGIALIPVTYFTASAIFSDLASRLAYRIYGDSTFTGRTAIWEFIQSHTELKPWFGWGFHAYWFVPNSPIKQAPGFVSNMPAAHSGYLDVRLETGFIGLAILLAFIVATLYRLEYLRFTDPRRTFSMTNMFVYVLVMNLMETIWFIPFDPLWILFLLLAGEAIRLSPATPAMAPTRIDARTRSIEPAGLPLTRPHMYPHALVRPTRA